MTDLHIRLRNRLHPITVVIRNLALYTNISAKNDMILEINRLLTLLRKFLSPEDNDMILESSIGDGVLRTLYASAENVIYLDSILDNVVSHKLVDDIANELVLETSEARAVSEYYVAGSNVLELVQSPIGAHVTLHTAPENEMILYSTIGGGSAVKYLSMEYDMELAASVRDTMIVFDTADPSDMELVSSANAVLTLYRLLYQMDADEVSNDLYLSDFDDMSLEEVDFIVIE